MRNNINSIKKNAKKITMEFSRGKRTWLVVGHSHMFQGFSLFPHKNTEIQRYGLKKGSITKKITIDEAEVLVSHEYCTNKECAKFLIEKIKSEKAFS